MKAPDFTGWASKNDLLCSDGRTIRRGAFAHQDGTEVPLVWSHQHNSPDNVLGNALLHSVEDGVYTEAFFNDTHAGQTAKKLVESGNIKSLSIFATKLQQRGGDVMHGEIIEVSLVLKGANIGAMIDNVNLSHSAGSNMDEEAIIYTGETIQHGDIVEELDPEDEQPVTEVPEGETPPGEQQSEEIQPESETSAVEEPEAGAESATTEGDEVGKQTTPPDLSHAAPVAEAEAPSDEEIQQIYDGMDEKEQLLLHYMVGEALEQGAASASGTDTAEHGTNITSATLAHATKEGFDMARNLFESQATANNGLERKRATLSHSQFDTILNDTSFGKLSGSVMAHAAEYGIEDIEFLFPDARTLEASPYILSRRLDWVKGVLDGTKHSPFTRIKSIVADITADEARAKGYVKGSLKKEEIIKLLKRVTTPTTVYKKQKIDRDDIVDITDFDVLAWIKAEMRVMLDEEIARSILVGDGRDVDDPDKINEDHLRPIAWDADMYAHKVNLVTDSTPAQTIEAILRARSNYKGSGNPTMYTTDEVLTDLILDKDTLGRRFNETEAALAAALRVKEIVVVEAMADTPEIVAIIVNLTDYTVGADKGGEINFFDDFDIDYNQQKFLLETRISGALTKPKSALVIKRAAGTVVTPQQPSYNAGTHVITIPNQTGVIYSIDGVDLTSGAQSPITETVEVEARPAAHYSFPHPVDSYWTFVF